MNEHVATYYYDMHKNYGVFDIYANYETRRDFDNRNVSFYDIYDKDGVCVNEGNPFYQFPTWEEVYNTYYMEHVN